MISTDFPRVSIASLFLGVAGLLLPSCDREEDSDPPESVPSSPLSEPGDDFSRRLEEFTGGHTKLVWSRYFGNGSDVFANFEKLQLWGIDTRDGKGVRPILEDSSNYARPLILPDGNGIVFSNKQTNRKPSGKRVFDPIVYRVDWDGGNLTELGPGYAMDVWRDPETGVDWVYTTDLIPTDRSSKEGTRLERFPLSDPTKREKVWDRTNVGTENVHLSRDGKRISCLFPWPHAGVLDLDSMHHQKYQHGCWPSMAPDNSYYSWVFDGAHKNLYMFTDKAEESWVVPVCDGPGVNGHETYHPRWSNHVRFFSMTGPYTGQTVVRSDSGEVEVLIGRFSDDMREVAEWFQVTDDTQGDSFPDLWIEGGELASITPITGSSTTVATTDASSAWPAAEGPHHFLWKNRDTANRVGDAESRESSVEARALARFGPHYEMLTDGGYFVPDSDSEVAAFGVGDDNPFTVEAVLTPFSTDQSGTAIFATDLVLRQDGDQLSFGLPGESLQSLGQIEAGKPTHVAITSDGETLSLYRDGEAVVADAESGAESGAGSGTGRSGGAPLPGVPFGFGIGWSGSLEGVAFSPGVASPEAIAASAASWQKAIAEREAIPTVRVRAKLVEMTESRPVEALDTYLRGLLGYLYEVEEVLEGSLDQKQVMVIHWTILDRKPLSGFPRTIGESYELLLQPYSAHPQLVSERQWNDLFDPSDPWFDVGTPEE